MPGRREGYAAKNPALAELPAGQKPNTPFPEEPERGCLIVSIPLGLDRSGVLSPAPSA